MIEGCQETHRWGRFQICTYEYRCQNTSVAAGFKPAPFMRQLRPEGNARLSEEEANVNDNLNAEEPDILERFERDELPSAPGAELEIEAGPPGGSKHLQLH